MRIFPVPANGDQRVEIAYYQELEVDDDALRYVYPLATSTRPEADSRTTGAFSINVEVKSAVPVAAVGSPSHGEAFVIARHAADYVQASLESRGGRLDRDVVIDLRLARPRTGLDLITSKDGRGDGYFLLTLTAGEDLGRLDAGMDYVFVLDISGSMGDDGKLATSKESIAAFVRTLGPDDHFEIVAFNVQPAPLFGALQPATADSLSRADAFLATQAAAPPQPRHDHGLPPAAPTAPQRRHPQRRAHRTDRTPGAARTHPGPPAQRASCIGVATTSTALLDQLADDMRFAACLARG